MEICPTSMALRMDEDIDLEVYLEVYDDEHSGSEDDDDDDDDNDDDDDDDE
jgi:hypothetical protein